jgi:hypothetical protein
MYVGSTVEPDDDETCFTAKDPVSAADRSMVIKSSIIRMAGRSLTTRANSYQRMDRRTYDNSIKINNNGKHV